MTRRYRVLAWLVAAVSVPLPAAGGDRPDAGVRALWERARRATAEKRWDEGARLAESILLAGQERPPVLTVLARCRIGTGRTDQARSLLNRALELDPDYAPARQMLRALEASSHPGSPPPAGTGQSRAVRGLLLPERLFGEASPLGREALEAYYKDDLAQASLLTEQALARDPGDPTALFARALLARDALLSEDVDTSIEFLMGRFPAAVFLRSLRLGPQPDGEEEATVRQVESAAAPDPFALAMVARYRHARYEGDRARAALEKAWSQMTATDRETLLALAESHLDLNDPDGASRALDLHQELFGTSGWHRYWMSRLYQARGQLGQAAEAAMDAYVRDPRRLLVLVWIQDRLASQGREGDVMDLWRLASETFPGREDLEGEALRAQQLAIRRAAVRSIQDGIWHVDVMLNVDRASYDRVMETLQDAYRTVGARLNYFPPRVRVRIEDQIVSSPGALAYYSPTDDTLYIGANEYMSDDPVGLLTARTVSRHEYTHYAQASLQRDRGLTQRIHISTKWLAEGLAEWASDGLGLRLARERELALSFLRGGPAPITELSPDAVTRAADPNRAQIERWYLQGNFMVTSLLQRGGDVKAQLDRLIGLSMDLQRKESLESSLRERFGLTLDAFAAGYTELMKADLVRIEKESWTGGRHETVVLEPAPKKR